MKYKLLLTSCCLCFSLFAQKQFITVDSIDIWVNVVGLDNRAEGEPVIVFESGHATPMDNWDKVLEGASALGALFTYDRPGIGKSEALDEIPTIKNVADRLVRILNHLEIPPPYILVGHSLGGLYIRGFAVHYPELLAGLIIIDPADFTETHINKKAYYEILNWSAEKVDSLINTYIEKRNNRHQSSPKPIRLEGQYLEDIRAREFTEITASALPNIPVHIITGGRFDMPEKFRSKAFDEEALFRSKLMHRIARWTSVVQSVDKGMLFYSSNSGHYVQWDDPELVVSSIRIAIHDHFKQ